MNQWDREVWRRLILLDDEKEGGWMNKWVEKKRSKEWDVGLA